MKDDGHTTGSGHPIGVAVSVCRDAISAVTESPTWSLDAADTRAALVELTRLQAQVAELEARVMSHAEVVEVTAESGATSTANWLAHATKLTRPAAHRKARLAEALASHDLTREALGRGEVHADQAGVITAAVEALPEDPSTRELCEKHLIVLAADHDAKALKILGRQILETVDPELADAHEAELLAREEREAAKKTSLRMHEDGHGSVHGRFTLPAATGAMLKTALQAIAAPKHVRATDGAGSYDHEQPSAERLGRALQEYVERYPTDRLPHSGGVNATMVVTIPFDTLLGGLKAASLSTGDKITAGEARRLACEAGIIPAVLNGDSEILDLGRKQRFHTKAQRLAIGLQQKHCQHPGCDTPAAGCHVHHREPWATGGPTNTRDAQLLCPRHHQLAHQPTPMRT